MAFNSSLQTIPKELMKFRLEKQLGRLKQILNEPSKTAEEELLDVEADIDTEDEEDRFQLYQRILSWFIMGRLAKSEFDGIFEVLLDTSELIGNYYVFSALFTVCWCRSS
jgi:hypothetical protein